MYKRFILLLAALFGCSLLFMNQTFADKVINEIARQAKDEQMLSDMQIPPAAEILQVRDDDIVIGNKDAKVTLIDYSSVTCSHCAEFDRTIYPKIEQEFIETGKVTYVKRLIPSNAPALKTSMFLSCVEDMQVKHKVIKNLLKYQEQWLFDQGSSYMEKLKYFALLSGVDIDDFGRCVADVDLGKKIYQNLIIEARAINLTHSPMLFVNGMPYKGSYEFDDLKKFIESFL